MNDKIDYQHLKNETINMLNEIQLMSSFENGNDVESRLLNMWRELPLGSPRPTELDLQIGNQTYPHSKHTVTYLIMYYLLENNHMDVVDRFISESDEEKDELIRIRGNYITFKRIVNEIEGDMMNQLEKFVENDGTRDLELHLISHQFLLLIYKGRYDEALRLCLGRLKSYMPKYINEVKPILKFLVNPVGIQDALDRSRMRLIEQFELRYWESNGMPNKCYLEELFETGTSAFLQLTRAGNLFFDKDDTTLPVEIKIPKGLNYHSLFICPVLKTLCVGDNIPVMLECGHVISSDAADVLSKEGVLSSFKCPYCPEMSKYGNILRLRL